MAIKLTEAQEAQLRSLKASFPFRIVYGAQHPDTKEWLASAVTSMRIPNKLAREGWEVLTLKVNKPIF